MHPSIIHHWTCDQRQNGFSGVGWKRGMSAGDTELVREQHTWAKAGLLTCRWWWEGLTHRLCFTNRGLVLTHKVEAGLAQLIIPQTGSEMGTHHSWGAQQRTRDQEERETEMNQEEETQTHDRIDSFSSADWRRSHSLDEHSWHGDILSIWLQMRTNIELNWSD